MFRKLHGFLERDSIHGFEIKSVLARTLSVHKEFVTNHNNVKYCEEFFAENIEKNDDSLKILVDFFSMNPGISVSEKTMFGFRKVFDTNEHD